LQLDSVETPAVRKASQRLQNLKGFAWPKASTENRALAFQSIFRSSFVSAVDDKIVAVTPIPELRLFMQDRIYIRRKPSGWQIGPEGVDYDAPDDWTITFTASPSETGSEVEVGMASLEGFEPPTRRLEGDRSLL
jgi:hypothetical protein